MTRRLPFAALLVVLGLAVTAVCSLGIGVRSTYGGRAAVDEPEYLLTALSLGEDGDLDIADELADERWRDFHDADLPVQTAVLDGGRRISPHDPLLPLLLALPMRWGGFVAAKAVVAAVAGLLAALTCWVAVRRFAVPLPVALAVVLLASMSPPLGVYATQVYPEIPAALLVMYGVALLTGPLRPGGLVGLGLVVTALPWLSVKYSPVAGVLAVIALVRLVRRDERRLAGLVAGGLALMGVVFALGHQVIYGGWTSYASGDHFEQPGEFAVVGTGVDGLGRTLRLGGLLVDRGFGLVPWQPMWLLAVPAVAFALRRRDDGWTALVLPLVAGWLTASYVALTAHGYWWPGRQVVVVLPIATVAVAVWASHGMWRRPVALTAGVVGVVTFGWLLRDGNAERITWVSGFETTGSPAYRALRPLLPDYRDPDAWTSPQHLAWSALLLALLYAGWRVAAPAPTASSPAPPEGSAIRVPTDERPIT
ncbi:MAG TPA: hypothetical protein VNA14_13705 [Mycobacteriales bacterium]|nr:hypothetical protein [Mycobacteriales bacterium]